MSQKLLLLATLTLTLYADPIAPPDLTVPCDGRTNDAHCVTGTIVFFRDGIPQTLALWPSHPLVDDTPTVPELPAVTIPEPFTVVPEPGYGVLIAILGLAGMAMYRWRNPA